jgi:hypothetical protein
LPLEGYAALKKVEKRLDPSDSDVERKRAVIDNALKTFPTTFDCYRYPAAGRAIIAAIMGGLAVVGEVRAWIAITVLAVILLTTLPTVAMTMSVLLRLRRSLVSTTA